MTPNEEEHISQHSPAFSSLLSKKELGFLLKNDIALTHIDTFYDLRGEGEPEFGIAVRAVQVSTQTRISLGDWANVRRMANCSYRRKDWG